MDTDELRTVLRGATIDLEPRAGLAQDVVRGGIRRQRRRRVTVVGAVAAVAVAIGVTSLATWQSASERVEQANDTRMSQPTHGDLAKDTAFIDEAVQVWQRKLPSMSGRINDVEKPVIDRVTTRPHVYWAGTTKAGKFAVVMQGMRADQDDRSSIIGLVGPDPAAGKAAVIAVDAPWSMAGRPDMAYRFGPAGRYLLALDEGRPLFLSEATGYDNAGKAQRTWRELKFADGVALVELPEGTGAMDTKLWSSDPARGMRDKDHVDIFNTDTAGMLAEKRRVPGMDWGRDGGWDVWVGIERPKETPGPRAAQLWSEGVERSGLLDQSGMIESGGAGWFAVFGLPQGHKAIVGEYAPAHSGPSRLYTVVVDAQDKVVQVFHGGPVDAKVALPVVVPLAGNVRGVVLKDAMLRFRDGPQAQWQGAGADALQIPMTAVQVEIRRPGTEPVIVDVP
jgi:hypothetical protein